MRNFEDYVSDYINRIATTSSANCSSSPVVDPVSGYRLELTQEGYNRYWGEYWDSHIFDMADADSVNAKLFQQPNGTNGHGYSWTNFIGAGIMPARNAMIVHHVAYAIIPITTASPKTDYDDFLYTANNVYCNLRKNQKMFGEWLSWRIPAGGGPYSFSEASSAGTRSTLQNGWPSHDAETQLWIPIVLSPMEQFEVNLNMDAATFAAIKAHDATAQIYVQFILEGEIFNKIS